MKEKEPKQSFLTWESAAIVLASVGFGAILGSRETRSKVGKEIQLCCRGFRNEVRKGQEKRRAAEFGLKARKVLIQVFPQGLIAEE